MDATDGLSAARAHRENHDWGAVYDAAQAAVAPADDRVAEADRLDLLAEAAWWLGRLDQCIEARERAYVIYDELGEGRRAGQCAVWLYEHYAMKARPAIGGAWLRRARHAVGDDPECAEHGALVLREMETAHGGGELDRAAEMATGVVALGRRLRNADIEAEALQALGRVQIDQKLVADGLANLDEAMLFAVDGRLGPYSTGKVYCSLISACEELGDLRRAAEWTEATARWSERYPFAIFPGICRVHRASVLQLRGDWVEAEREATQACTELVDIHVPNAAAAYSEVGEIRRRLGELDAAEEAFARAEELCGRQWPGVALLRLAQGRVADAGAAIARALEEASGHRLAYGKLLPASAQIALAREDLAACERDVNELEAIATEFDNQPLSAAALTARGRLQLAQGDASGACRTLHSAVERWLELDVPYEVATARMLLGQACQKGGDESGAAASFGAAEATFVELGATLDTRFLRQCIDRVEFPAGLSPREVEVLKLVAVGRTNREIASELYISEKTVSRHLSNIFAKAGVSTRAAAAAFAFEHKLMAARL